MRLLTAVILIFLVTLAPAGANDRPLMYSRAWTPMDGEHPHIRMVQEDIHMDVHEKTYDIIANFEFYNDGAATSAKMGFPEWGYDYPAEPSAFKNFRSTIDGASVKTKRVVKVDNPEVYHAWWVKTVPFQAHQTRYVSVSFTAPVLQTPGDQPVVEYDFTGGNWKGLVAKSSMVITLPYDHWMIPINIPRGHETTVRDWNPGFSRHGRTATYVRENWKATQTFQLVFVKLPCYTPELSRGPLTGPLTDRDLAGKTARELTILRNAIVAGYGRRFSDPVLRRYFESQFWYGVDPEYTDAELSPVDRQNMQFIQHYQDIHNLRW